MISEARRLGFDAVGIARADVPLDEDFERYEAFVDAGMHGEMKWLAGAREARRRLDRATILEGAKSVVCVAKSYRRRDDASDPPVARAIARYARGRDYHTVMRRKVRRLAAFIRALGVSARPLMDVEPILERAWAVRAGLGFIGKNGMLIVPGLGSMVLLGEVVTTLEIEPDVAGDHKGRCGTCTLCLDACPTRAFERPFVLDPRRCISYLTIEKRGAIPEELRAPIGEHLFGCDDCQTVCPFNGAHRACDAAMFEPLPRYVGLTLKDILDPRIAKEMTTGSPLRRTGPEGLARNAAIVLGNRGEKGPALEGAARSHESEIVREAARWAMNR